MSRVLPRLNLTVILVSLALALSAWVELPARQISFALPGWRLSFVLPPAVLTISLALLMSVIGTQHLVYAHPRVQVGQARPGPAEWILPPAITGLAAWGLAQSPSQAIWLLTLLATAMTLALTLWLLYRSIDSPPPGVELWKHVLIYSLTLLGMLAVQSSWFTYGITARALVVGTWAALLSLVRFPPSAEPGDLAGGSLATGVVIGQCQWVLSYLNWSPGQRALLALLIFHLITGLISRELKGELDRRAAVEFGIVAIAGLVLLWLS